MPTLSPYQKRKRRRYLRDVEWPVLSGLHSRDPQRKVRMMWLADAAQERAFGNKWLARRFLRCLKRQPFVAVLP